MVTTQRTVLGKKLAETELPGEGAAVWGSFRTRFGGREARRADTAVRYFEKGWLPPPPSKYEKLKIGSEWRLRPAWEWEPRTRGRGRERGRRVGGYKGR